MNVFLSYWRINKIWDMHILGKKKHHSIVLFVVRGAKLCDLYNKLDFYTIYAYLMLLSYGKSPRFHLKRDKLFSAYFRLIFHKEINISSINK